MICLNRLLIDWQQRRLFISSCLRISTTSSTVDNACSFADMLQDMCVLEANQSIYRTSSTATRGLTDVFCDGGRDAGTPYKVDDRKTYAMSSNHGNLAAVI